MPDDPSIIVIHRISLSAFARAVDQQARRDASIDKRSDYGYRNTEFSKEEITIIHIGWNVDRISAKCIARRLKLVGYTRSPESIQQYIRAHRDLFPHHYNRRDKNGPPI
jgi:hypothetical protein